jgi:hypothetical protein
MTAVLAFEAAQQRCLTGIAAAQARLASLTPEVAALVAETEARLLSKFCRMFAGTEDMAQSKGHQPCIVVSVEEMREFRKAEPATHRWAEFERSVLA